MSEDAGSMMLTPTCPLCGGTELTIPDNPTANSMVECASCGTQIARYGAFMAHVRNAASDALKTIDDEIAKAMRDDGGDRKG